LREGALSVRCGSVQSLENSGIHIALPSLKFHFYKYGDALLDIVNKVDKKPTPFWAILFYLFRFFKKALFFSTFPNDLKIFSTWEVFVQ